MPDSASPVPAPAPATPARAPAAEPPASTGAVPASGFGRLAEGGFRAMLGNGLSLSAAQMAVEEGVDLSDLPQPVPGVHLRRARWNSRQSQLELSAEMAVPHLAEGEFTIYVNTEGRARFSAQLRRQLQIAALGNPNVTLSLSEEGRFGGSVTIDQANLSQHAPRNLSVTGGGTLTLDNGHFSGDVNAELAYANLGSGGFNVAFDEAGQLSGSGHLDVDPPFLSQAHVDLSLSPEGALSGNLTLAMTEARSPIPALALTGGTLSIGYDNGEISGSLEGFQASYRDLATLTASASINRGQFSGTGALDLAVPGLDTAHGTVNVREGHVSGSLHLAASAFPDALPVTNGEITATLTENGQIGLSGNVGVTLGPAGTGQLEGSYSPEGEFRLGAIIDLNIPGLQSARFEILYQNSGLSGEAQIAIDPNLIPGIDASATVRYQENLWSGETTVRYTADDGKLSGSLTVTVAQTEEGHLQLGGTGELEAQIAPRLRGMLTATILPEGGIDVSGSITVTEPLELFPEQRLDRELFSYSQNIPLWAILVAIIRVRAGIRAGIGPGVFRNITVEGSYTLGSDNADPTFSITGEMFIPAFVEAYVAFGAGLGLDVVLGSLTGGIEGVATAGLYGAISVVPELAYEDGDWAIDGTATLAAGARFKLGLNAWAEVEALWVTVWERQWELAEWMWNIGPDLALQAHMHYRFGQPEAPEIEFNTSDIDTESMIQAAMPEDGPAPSGAREALQNRAEWQGQLREQRQAAVPPDVAAQANQPTTAPQPAQQPAQASGAPAPAPGAAAGAAGTPESGQTGAAQQTATDGAAQADDSARGTAPASEVPGSDQPRYPQPVTLATLDEPAAIMPRTPEQQQQDVDAAGRVTELAVAAAADSSALEAYFPRIKERFRLVELGYVSDSDGGLHIEGGINPGMRVNATRTPVKGDGVAAAGRRGSWQTEITNKTGNLGGTTVGLEMEAKRLGPEHPQGSGTSGGQEALFSQLPTNSKKVPNYIRGHLLNAELGGAGKDYNLFPITEQANSRHHAEIERQVKKVVNEDKRWVRYKVCIRASSQLIPLKNQPGESSGYMAVNCVIDAEADYVTLSKRLIPFANVRIDSQYDSRYYASGASSDFTAPAQQGTPQAADLGLIPQERVVPEDQAIVPKRASAQTQALFPSGLYRDITSCRRNANSVEQACERLFAQTHGVGDVRLRVIASAYRAAETITPNGGFRDVTSSLSAADIAQFNTLLSILGNR